MLAKKCLLVGIFTLLSLSLAIAAPPAVHPTTGEPLVIDCLRGTPDAIDGDLSDWNLEAMTPAVLDVQGQLYSGQAVWTGPADSSGKFYLLWDDKNIYIAVVMKDDKLSMNKTGGDIWNADCIEIFFSTTDAVATHTATVHYQYGFNANNQRWNWCNMDGSGAREPDYLQIASSRTADGYICEASIEYGRMLSLDFSVGNAIGFHPVFDDADNGDRKLQMTWTSREAHDQSLGFGHIILSPEPAIAKELSNKPSPADEATDVPRDVVLSWTPGIYADKHDVYFGTNFNDVNDASRTNPRNVLASQNQSANTYDPAALLEFGQTYYWRVDEVNAPPDYTIFKGGVWSFKAEPFAYPIENIIATASSSQLEIWGPQNTVNGSGLDAHDLHSTDAADMWLSSMTGPQPTWIRYEFDRIYKLHQMWVWNYNTLFEPMVGFGVKNATIEYSVDGTNWTTLGTTHEFARAAATPGYAHNTTIDFGSAEARYVRLTANSNWGVGGMKQYGLSEVRFLYIPVKARQPYPASGATDVPIGTLDQAIDVTLSWRAGRKAAKHNVYFSESRQAVIDGTAPVTTVTEARYGPLSLGLGKTYYWRVDEVNEAEIPTTWQGELWDFTTQKYFIVDDFEAYNDDTNRIFDVWADYAVNNTGATVGNFDPPFAERTIVHSGRQSMPYRYDNDGTVNEGTAYEKTGTKLYSEAEHEWAAPQDWTRRSVNTLTLYFQGAATAFAEAAGTITMSAAGADIWGTSDQFRYAYKQLNGDGQIVTKVVSIGGSGTNEWRKAGVMIRESLDAGSRHAFMAITPAVAHGVAFQNRPTLNGSSVNASQNVGFTTPCWVKLVRQGGQFTGFYSSDGVKWVQVPAGTGTDASPNPQTINMSPNAYIGLALTSHESGVSCVAQFSNVTITGATGAWVVADIGVAQPGNDPTPMYVVLQDSANKTAVVKHTDPAATTIAAWTQWNIPLTDFTGLNLRAIKKISIGVGDRLNPQRGGSGRLYIDDIQLRLAPPAQ